MTVFIDAIRDMTCSEFREAVGGFSAKYDADWRAWLATPDRDRPRVFGQTLRRWQAARPREMRRTEVEASHGPPFLDDLLVAAVGPVERLGSLTTCTIRGRTPDQDAALHELWAIFTQLTVTESPTAVGITKAVLLVTEGRIGPALDKNVRDRLGVSLPKTADDWIELLEGIAGDIATFDVRNGTLNDCVSERFREYEYGRLYDMALGPRERPRLGAPSRGSDTARPNSGMKTTEITVQTGNRRGLVDITAECARFAAEASGGGGGLLNVFVPHATCGLAVMELGSGSEDDLLAALDRLMPRDDRYVHRHGTTGHGADHLVPAFLPPSITIPIVGGRLALGTWQSIALVDTNVDNQTRHVRFRVVKG